MVKGSQQAPYITGSCQSQDDQKERSQHSGSIRASHPAALWFNSRSDKLFLGRNDLRALL